MSYDIRISVKVEGCGKYAMIAEPEFAHPTYNLSKMFRKCMDWDYETYTKNESGNWASVYYPCDFVLERVEHGIKELRTNKEEYKQYNAPNGWGTVSSAIEALESLRNCIYEQTVEIPLNCLYMSW